MSERTSPESVERHLPLPHLAYQVLVVLAGGPQHGYGVAKEVEVLSDGRTRPGTGSLYLSLSKLCEDGLVEESDPPPGAKADARRKYYRLTALGRRVALAESRRLEGLLSRARRDLEVAEAPTAEA